jgi:hypothetical protein
MLWAWRKTKPVKVKPVKIEKFLPEETVVLLVANPFKGSLKCKTPYRVIQSSPTHIKIRANNGTEGWFNDKWFSRADGWSAHSESSDDEYWDVIKAQDIIERVNGNVVEAGQSATVQDAARRGGSGS